MKMHDSKILTFYRPEMAQFAISMSKSPSKPRLLMEFLEKQGLSMYFEMNPVFEPFKREDFLLAHTEKYVDAFMEGVEPLCSANDISWTPEFRDSVTYTNSSFYHALRHACLNPRTITFSPTSGFHHAWPEAGKGFCTFSGQVIASTKIFRELGMPGCYIDLDGHFGNSIEDSRYFVPDLHKSIPVGFNVNPAGSSAIYMFNLKQSLIKVEEALVSGKVQYVVFAHGADSHVKDDFDFYCKLSTDQWLECADLVVGCVKSAEKRLGKPVPMMLALFGGYRKDNYDAVLTLHSQSLSKVIKNMCEPEDTSALDRMLDIKIDDN